MSQEEIINKLEYFRHNQALTETQFSEFINSLSKEDLIVVEAYMQRFKVLLNK